MNAAPGLVYTSDAVVITPGCDCDDAIHVQFGLSSMPEGDEVLSVSSIREAGIGGFYSCLGCEEEFYGRPYRW